MSGKRNVRDWHVARYWIAGIAAAFATFVSAAGAATVNPIDQSVVDRVSKVVPLDASGSQIAFSATPSDDPSRALGDAVYIANGDGSNLRRVGMLNGRTDVAIYELTASGDEQWLAYNSLGKYVSVSGGSETSGRPAMGIVNVATGALRRVRYAGADQTDAILAGRSWFYATPERGAAMRVDAQTGAVKGVPLVGNGASTQARAESWTPSEDRQEAGFCSAVGPKFTRVAIGVLDRASGLVRTAAASLHGAGGCQVSDDGSTVATVGMAGSVDRVFAVRDGKSRVITIGRGLPTVVALSPTGRYAIVESGDPSANSSGKVALVDLDRKLVHVLRGVDGLTGYVHNNSPTAVAAWAADEQTVVFDAARWGAAGRAGTPAAARLVAVSTGTGAAHALAHLVLPAGVRFDGTPVPQAFTDDGRAVGVIVPTSSSTTDAVPYRVPLDGGGAMLLFSSSVRSYGSVTRSPDKSHAWISAGWSCSSIYRFPMMSIAGNDPWGSPWVFP